MTSGIWLQSRIGSNGKGKGGEVCEFRLGQGLEGRGRLIWWKKEKNGHVVLDETNEEQMMEADHETRRWDSL